MIKDSVTVQQKQIIELTRGVPPAETFPIKQLEICASEVLEKNGHEILQYANSKGFLPLREYIAESYGVSPDRIIIGQGSLQILDHLLRGYPAGTLHFGIEQPTYDRTLTQLQRADVAITPAYIHQEETDFSPLETFLKSGNKLDFFYAIPDFQNPTGRLMPLEERQWLVNMASQYGFKIIEDSPYRQLQYCGEALPSCYDLAPEHVIQMSSFSKLVSPGLRVGYMVLPEDLYGKVAKTAEDTYINPSYFSQAIVHDFCERGWLDEHLIYLKQLYSQRCERMAKRLKEELDGLATWTEPLGGFFIGCEANVNASMPEILEAALEHGIKLSDGRHFFIYGGDQFIRLPFCALNEEKIDEGIRRLAETLRSID